MSKAGYQTANVTLETSSFVHMEPKTRTKKFARAVLKNLERGGLSYHDNSWYRNPILGIGT
jgi:hypothetical protein